MNEITKELLEALKLSEEFLCGPTAWTQEQENNLVEKVSCAIAKAEAALAEPQADEDGWIPWDGGKCPVSPAMLVEVKLRSGQSWLNKDAEKGSFWGWYHGPKKTPDDIIAYRPLKI